MFHKIVQTVQDYLDNCFVNFNKTSLRKMVKIFNTLFFTKYTLLAVKKMFLYVKKFSFEKFFTEKKYI